jgi:hypothetical protein
VTDVSDAARATPPPASTEEEQAGSFFERYSGISSDGSKAFPDVFGGVCDDADKGANVWKRVQLTYPEEMQHNEENKEIVPNRELVAFINVGPPLTISY